MAKVSKKKLEWQIKQRTKIAMLFSHIYVLLHDIRQVAQEKYDPKKKEDFAKGGIVPKIEGKIMTDQYPGEFILTRSQQKRLFKLAKSKKPSKNTVVINVNKKLVPDSKGIEALKKAIENINRKATK